MATKILGKVAIMPKGEFNELTEYQVLDLVTYQGSSYISLQKTTGNLPTDEEYWQLVAEKGDKGEQGIQGVQGVQGEKGDKGDTGEIPEGTIESDDVDSIEVVETLPDVEQTNVLYLVKESVYLDTPTETEATNE